MTRTKKNYTMPIIVCFFLFAMISFVTGFQNPFGVILKSQLSLSNVQSQLGNLANFGAYLFMGIPAGLILRKKGYRYTAIAAVLTGVTGVALMFVSSLFPIEDKEILFSVYLIGAFVAGFSMCMLNTVVNPMLNTLGGGGKRGNSLLQFGGSLNSLSATICPVLVGYLMGSDLSGCSLADARPALYIAAGIFILAFIVLSMSHLPEPILDEERAEEKKKSEHDVMPTVKGALRFPQLLLGIISIFLYVGVEVGIPNFANLYMTADSEEQARQKVESYESGLNAVNAPEEALISMSEGSDAMNLATEAPEDTGWISEHDYKAAKDIVNADSNAGLGMNVGVAGAMVGMYWFLMLIGRLLGGILGGRFSSRSMLMFTSSAAIILLLLAIGFDGYDTIKMPGFANGSFYMEDVSLSVFFLVLCGLCTSVMWGAIFNLAVEGLGKYVAVASGLFMVMVCGGGVLPLLQGWVADISGYLSSYWVLVGALTFILYYALWGCKMRHRDKDAIR